MTKAINPLMRSGQNYMHTQWLVSDHFAEKGLWVLASLMLFLGICLKLPLSLPRCTSLPLINNWRVGIREKALFLPWRTDKDNAEPYLIDPAWWAWSYLPLPAILSVLSWPQLPGRFSPDTLHQEVTCTQNPLRVCFGEIQSNAKISFII